MRRGPAPAPYPAVAHAGHAHHSLLLRLSTHSPPLVLCLGMFSWEDTGLRLNGTNDAVLPKNKVSWTGYVINVTSQKWLTPQDFNFTPFGGRQQGHIWWHIMVVVVPSNRRPGSDQSFLYMTGGNNGPESTSGVPKASDEDMLVISDCFLELK